MKRSTSGVATRRPNATEVLTRKVPPRRDCNNVARLSASSISRWIVLHFSLQGPVYCAAGVSVRISA